MAALPLVEGGSDSGHAAKNSQPKRQSSCVLVFSSTLNCHIAHVVGVCAKKQIVWPNAWRIIAAMKDVQAIRNRAVMKFPRYAMDARRFTVVSKISIPVAISLSCPFPAVALWALAGCFIDLSPEAISGGFSARRAWPKRAATSRAEPLPSPRSYLKRVVAVFTYKINQLCDNMIFGHGVTSETGCKMSRLGMVLDAPFRAVCILTQSPSSKEGLCQ